VNITNGQIRSLRAEAAEAGDFVQVVLCDLALSSCPARDVPQIIGETDEAMRLQLKALGVTEGAGSDLQARELCGRAIRAAQAGAS
jgi:hypothetical protein